MLAVVAACLATSGSARQPGLTEFGATRAVWRAHHTPDPDPKLVPGCCFLPRQRDRTDRWFTVNYDEHTRVDSFEMSFVPAVAVGVARQVVKQEAGPGARLVYDLKKGGCEQIEYRSTLLSRAVRSAMFAELSSNFAGGAPTSHAGDIIVEALPIGDKVAC